MNRAARERLLDPKPGGKIADARDFGIDLTLLAENLRYTPAERIKRNDQAINSILKIEKAVREAKAANKAKAQ